MLPSTKAEVGHDEAIDFDQATELVGDADLAGKLGLLAVTVFAVGALIGATGLLVRRARRADPEQNEASAPGSAPGGTRTVTA